jgi:hypothetical protein
MPCSHVDIIGCKVRSRLLFSNLTNARLSAVKTGEAISRGVNIATPQVAAVLTHKLDEVP